MSTDARVPNRIDAYAKFWQKDSAKDSQTDTDNRLDNYKDVVNGPCPFPFLVLCQFAFLTQTLFFFLQVYVSFSS